MGVLFAKSFILHRSLIYICYPFLGSCASFLVINNDAKFVKLREYCPSYDIRELILEVRRSEILGHSQPLLRSG